MNVDADTSSAEEDTRIIIDITGEDTTLTVANDHNHLHDSLVTSNVSSLDAAFEDVDINTNAREEREAREDAEDAAAAHEGRAVVIWRARRDAERAQLQAAERARQDAERAQLQAAETTEPAQTAATFSEGLERANDCFRPLRQSLENFSMTENIFTDDDDDDDAAPAR